MSPRQQLSEEAMDTERNVKVASPSVQREPGGRRNGAWRCFRFDGSQHRIPPPGRTPTIKTNLASQSTSAKNFVPTKARTLAWVFRRIRAKMTTLIRPVGRDIYRQNRVICPWTELYIKNGRRLPFAFYSRRSSCISYSTEVKYKNPQTDITFHPKVYLFHFVGIFGSKNESL